MSIETHRNLLIGVTGSVATIKIYELVNLLKNQYHVKIIATQHSLHFFNPQNLTKQLQVQVYTDQLEYQQWKKKGDPVLHIQLKKWAHCLLIAPLGANTLAKIANGICDNLLTLVCRAWNMTLHNKSLKYPLIVCPAMNTDMYIHPLTQKQLVILQSLGMTIISPIEKTLVCGQNGIGAMQNIDKIAAIINKLNNIQ